jgi:hypothetical protein
MVIFNRLFAFLFGVALAGAGVVVVVEAVSIGTNSGFVWIPGASWLSSFERTAWSSTLVIGVSAAVAFVCLILLIAELRPRRKRFAPFSTDTGTWVLLRRSTEIHLQRRLSPAVESNPVKVRLTATDRRWRVKIVARSAVSTKAVLETTVAAELRRLHSPDGRVSIRTTGARKAS